jgi:hypothetical protein
MQDFLKNIRKLEAALRASPCSDATVEIYFGKLKNVSLRQLESAIDGIIENETFFPSIALIKKYLAAHETVRNEAVEILDRIAEIKKERER